MALQASGGRRQCLLHTWQHLANERSGGAPEGGVPEQRKRMLGSDRLHACGASQLHGWPHLRHKQCGGRDGRSWSRLGRDGEARRGRKRQHETD